MNTIPSDTPSHASRRSRGRLVLLLSAGLLLLFLLVSLGTHLTGRSRFASAAEAFKSALGDEVPDLSKEGLRAQVAAFAPEPVDDPENAARWLIAGAQAIVWAEGEVQKVKELCRMPTSQWTSGQTVFAREFVARNEASLTTLHRATPLAASSYGIAYEDFIAGEIPDLIGLLRAAYLLTLDSRLALVDGDVEQGLASLDTVARLTDTLRQETLLIFVLIAHATEKLVLHGISEVLSTPEPSAASPEVLAHLERLIPVVDLLAAGKRIIALDAAVVSVGALEGRSDLWTEASRSRWRAYYRGHRRAAESLDAGRQVASLVDQSYAQARERFLSGSDHSRLEDLGPAYRNAFAKGQAIMSQRRLVAAALEMRRLGITQGAYPSSCPVLEILDTPDPLVGKPLVCQAGPDGTVHLEIPGVAELTHEITPGPSLWILKVDLPALPSGDARG